MENKPRPGYMPSPEEQRYGREHEQNGEHNYWPELSLSHVANNYELSPFVKGCDPREPPRAYTKSSFSTSGSTELLKFDTDVAVAEAVKNEPADRIDCKQRFRDRPACLPEYC
jgi:hypothetical protein